MTDQQFHIWLDRLIDGDLSAFDFIYSQTKHKVYGTVAALVSNKEDVNDIVSEIYCQLWKALPSYDRSRPFMFWLNGIVIKQVHNWRRQIWRKFRLFERNDRLSERVPVEMPDEPLLAHETHQEMRDIILTLPFKLRIVIIYRYSYEYTYEQIAELLQIPIGTVKSRTHLALKQIRKRYNQQLQQEGMSEHVYLKQN